MLSTYKPFDVYMIGKYLLICGFFYVFIFFLCLNFPFNVTFFISTVSNLHSFSCTDHVFGS